MIYLLDVNLLIALAWPTHIYHLHAQEWFAHTGSKGWASCPISQTGFVRISSNPRFIDGAVSPLEAISLLKSVSRSTKHQFWPDRVNLTARTSFSFPHLIGHRQVTDAYLLSLVMHRRGKLATLDPAIGSLLPDEPVRKKYLEVIAI